MSLGDEFALSPSEELRAAFEHAHQCPSSPLRSTTYPGRTSTKRTLGTSLTSEGKRSAEDCIHLTMRCKKMKLSHAFYRCGSLFYRSAPTSDITSGPTLTPPASEAASAPTSTPTPRRYIPQTTRRLSSWWASASRHDGDARVSRMCPDEAIWVANAGSEWQGPKWQTLWRQRVNANKAEDRSSSGRSSNLDGTLSSSDELSSPTAAPKGSSKFSFRSRPSRSVSSPPNWTPPTSQPHTHHSGEHTFPWAPIPLKQHLLAVLRARSAESGNSSRGGDAGLKFKKWVIWNHWSRKGRCERADAEEGEFDGIDNSDDSDEEDMISPTTHDDDLPDDPMGYDATSHRFESEKEPMWSEDPTNLFDGENASDAALDTTVVPLPIVLCDEPGVTVVDPIVIPLLVNDDLVESKDVGAESNYTLDSSSSVSPILLQQPHLLSLRPNLRRSHSAPSSISSLSSSSPGSVTLSGDSSMFMFGPTASAGANGVVELVCVDRKDGATSPPIACEG
ncbi:BZ3500_MvSof-1268-A1-R1_Chr3-3g06524 [Microbotryum saponariae]|uniref:BZ3500_MvSof-1268-A1-R1_Chr3-3g06524 protein n=1 Tax=Microbotryum saponariae TaxID=289078 RepID=A0A2X0LCA0_9BASI|nr:BZ3500_MvSof-1268-A1-R1_Chr3-3g06524 [Microbotryum saponariae]SDA04491.1 BZ3501_MvSof-1269-A2-R1_Chr3-2g06211 [Microbotryum saponariae]